MEEIAALEPHPKAIALLLESGALDRCESHEVLIDTGEGIESAYSTALRAMADEDPELEEFRDDPKMFRAELEKAIAASGDECYSCSKNMSD